MLTDLAESLVTDFEVVVVTSAKLYQDPTVILQADEVLDRVTVRRIRTTRFGRANLWRRAIDYASFYVGMLWWLMRHVRKGDLVVLMTDPPLMPLMSTAIIRARGGQVVNWLQDIYPEIAERLGAFPGPAWLANLVRGWRNQGLRKAVMNVALGPSMQRYLAENQVLNVQVIPNWADDQAVTPLGHKNNPLREDWGLEGQFAVVYSGNFGRAHRFEALVDAAELLRKDTNISFVLVGEGAALDDVYNDVQARGLHNVRFEPYQARDMLPFSLGAADVHLVSLHHLMEGLVFPSKLYGVLAAGRPSIFLGDEDSDIARVVRDNDIGEVVPPDDGAVLASAIRRLAADPEHCRAMGNRARQLCDSDFSKEMSLAHWNQLFLNLA